MQMPKLLGKMCLLHSAVHSRMAGFANMVYRKQYFAGVHLAVIQLAILGRDSGHCLIIVLETAQLFSGEPQQAHCQKAVAAVRLLLWSQVRWISRPTLTKNAPFLQPPLPNPPVLYTIFRKRTGRRNAQSHSAAPQCIASYP